jgi:hypothetical protein
MITIHTTALLAYLIAAHCIGDGILQNHWMQTKSKDSLVCTAHVIAYLIPFWWIMFFLGLHWWVIVLIGVQHWLQDRYALHLRWMRLYKQTDAALWPVGPLYVDQCWHIAFLALFSLFN